MIYIYIWRFCNSTKKTCLFQQKSDICRTRLSIVYDCVIIFTRSSTIYCYTLYVLCLCRWAKRAKTIEMKIVDDHVKMCLICIRHSDKTHTHETANIPFISWLTSYVLTLWTLNTEHFHSRQYLVDFWNSSAEQNSVHIPCRLTVSRLRAKVLATGTATCRQTSAKITCHVLRIPYSIAMWSIKRF